MTTAVHSSPCSEQYGLPDHVFVLPPTKALVVRALREAGARPVAWCYLGESVSRAQDCLRWLDGLAERLHVGELVGNAARHSRQAFVEYIGELSERYHSEDWWLSSLSEKNPYISKVFLRVCFVQAAMEAVRERRGRGTLLIIVEDRAVRGCLRSCLDGAVFREVTGSGLLVWIGEYLECWARRVHFIGRQLAHLTVAGCHVSRRAGEMGCGAAPLTLLHGWVDYRCFDRDGRYQSINFGDLADYLASKGRAVAIVPTVLPVMSFRAAVRALVRSNVPFILPQRSLRVADVLRLVGRSLDAPPEQTWPLFQGLDISALIREDRRRDWVMGRACYHGVLMTAVARWRAAGIRIEFFIYPFENHQWEKAYLLALRRNYPDIFLIGYQDANLPVMALNFFVAPRERGLVPLPDMLITNGWYSHDLLAAGGHDPVRLCRGGALRYRHLMDTVVQSTRAPVILVTTSIGETLACELLWKVVLAFEGEPKVRVVVKCHPGLPFTRLSAVLGIERLPSHFEVSEKPVAELLRRCGALAYMDSTTSLEALALGVPVVHVASDFNLDFDPLDGVPEVRVTVRTPEALRREALAAFEGGGEARAQRGREVILQFFGVPEASVYEAFLNPVAARQPLAAASVGPAEAPTVAAASVRGA